VQHQAFGRYQIVELIGQGGMGNVYRAHDPQFSRDVALKLLPAGFLQDPLFRERFARETEIMGGLEHAAIIPVYDAGEDHGQPFLVMRLMSGGTLADKMSAGSLSLADTEHILTALCSGLDRAHTRQIIHRDLKPTNILFDEDGNPYIADFGIARLAAATTTMTIIGTPQYMAPEQAEGITVNAQADIYQLGVILYEMLTGKVPFDADTPAALMYQHVYTPVPSLTAVRPDLPPALPQVVNTAMAKKPADRFSSGSELAAAFSHALTATGAAGAPPPQETEVLSERPETKPQAPTDTPRRRALPWLWIGLPLLIGLLFLGYRFLFTAPPEPENPSAAIAAEDAITPPPTSSATAAPLTITVVATATTAENIPAVVPATATAAPSSPTALPPASTAVPPTPAPPPAINPQDNAPLIFIPAGEFQMGIPAAQGDYLAGICEEKCDVDDFTFSQPARQVRLEAYLIYETEVTNAQYAACVQQGGCPPPAATTSNQRSSYYDNPAFANYPVVHVNWFAANTYCRWAGGRLPTEAEWEKAARGTDGRLFPWGNNPPTMQLANNNMVIADTTPVDAFTGGASPYGVLNMTGNVWEWTADWYEADYYSYAPAENPQGPPSSSINQRVGRGGSWGWNHGFSSAVYRDWWEPDKHGSGVGFRCVVDLDY